MASTAVELMRRRMMGSNRGASFDWEDFATKLIERTLNGDYILPNGITIIGERAFVQVSSTNKFTLVLPSTVTSISSNAFNSASSITAITIPSSVTSIGGNAFLYCTGLTYMIFEGTTPPTLTNFGSLGATTYTFPIYVPDSAVNTYKTANIWSDYASRIFPISDLTT